MSTTANDNAPLFKSNRGFSTMIAGILAGSASTILLYPLDLVHLQVSEGPKLNSAIKESSHISKTPRRITAISIAKGVIKHEGVLGLYRGLGPALVGSAASWGGYFFIYERLKSNMLKQKLGNVQKSLICTEGSLQSNDSSSVKLGPLENFTAACMAGSVMVALTNPIWLVKTRMQLELKHVQQLNQEVLSKKGTFSTDVGNRVKPPYRNMVDAMQTIVREEGPLALYKGSLPAMILVSHGGVQFVAYEFLKNQFGVYKKSIRTPNKNNHGIYQQLEDSIGYLTMGAVSKIIASTATYPVQLIKSRLQQRSHSFEFSENGEAKLVKKSYTGVIDCIKRIVNREGLSGFFKGCIPNALRVAPGAAITFFVYESVMDQFS